MSRSAVDGLRYEGRDLEAMAFAVNYHRCILGAFRPYLGDRVVEVGGGDGTFTCLLAAEAIESVTAVEPSPEMFPRLLSAVSQLAPVRVSALNGVLGEFMDELKDQGVTSCVFVNVLEHVEDDVAELRRVYELLPAGGHVCLFVPALMWLYSAFDLSIGHRRRYTRAGLEERCREAGFTVVFARYFDVIGVLPWLLRFRILKAAGLSARSVKWYDRVGVPIMKRLEAVIEPPIGKNVILVATRCG